VPGPAGAWQPGGPLGRENRIWLCTMQNSRHDYAMDAWMLCSGCRIQSMTVTLCDHVQQERGRDAPPQDATRKCRMEVDL